MQIKTKALVVQAIRYSEADLIVKMFTEELGLVSYMVKGVLKTKKGKLRASFFQLGNFLEIDALHKNKKGLYTLKEVKPLFHFQSIHSNIIKSSLITFLFEIINQILIEEQPDEYLFDFFSRTIKHLDEVNDISLFHIAFLLELTSFQGCYPDDLNSKAPEFDLESGQFTIASKNYNVISGNALINFKTILNTEIKDLDKVKIKKTERKELLDNVLRYYRFHMPGYREPKSLLILEQLFS